MKKDNRTVGGRFEQEFAEILHKNGFWCHVMQQNKAGQPADIIAVKGQYHTLIDAKVISGDDGFPLKRIEENQRTAMTMFMRRGKENCWFAMKLADGSIWVLSFTFLLMMKNSGKKSVPERVIRTQRSLETWLHDTELWAEET